MTVKAAKSADILLTFQPDETAGSLQLHVRGAD